MSEATVSQNLARFLMVFGLAVVVASVGVSLQKRAIIQDVWDRAETFEDPLDPSTSTSDEVQANLQDVATLAAWETNAQLLGIGSLLAGILVTFRMSICSAAGTVKVGLPKFWQAFFAARDGEATPLTNGVEMFKTEAEEASR